MGGLGSDDFAIGLLKEVTLVDCTQAAKFDLDEPMTQGKLESNNWYVLNEAFSLPIGRCCGLCANSVHRGSVSGRQIRRHLRSC